MSITDLQMQLDQLQEAINQTSQLIFKLSKAQPSDELPGESTTDLTADIRDNLHASEESLELLKQDIDDLAPTRAQGYGTRRPDRTLTPREQERETAHKKFSTACIRMIADLQNLRTRFRRANLASKKAAERALQAEQAAYLSDLRAAADAMAASSQTTTDPNTSASHPDKTMTQSQLRTSLFSTRRPHQKSPHQQQKTGTDLLLTTSSDLTLSLRRAHQTITSELSRSRFASDTLAASNAALEDLNKRYGGLDDLLSRSRGLLGTLLRSQKSDTWFLETAIYLLMGTIAWLVFRRLLYGPLWWFAYLPLRLAYNTVALIVGSGRRKAVVGDVRPRFVPVRSVGTVETGTPLVVKPSATDGVPTRGVHGRGRGMNVGAGGAGAKRGPGEDGMGASRWLEEDGTGAKRGLEGEGSMTAVVSSIVDNSALYATATAIGSPSFTATTLQDPDNVSTGDHQQQQQQHQQEQQQQGFNADQQQQQQRNQGQHQEVRRADGTVLRERDSEREPPNPKKRMWEEPRAQEGPQPQKRDEL